MALEDALGGLVEGAFDIGGGLLSAAQNRQSQRFNADLQREFAQHGIQWRVEDAKRAGLHPLAALGAFPSSGGALNLQDPSGEGLSRAGQAIGGAITRGMSEDDKRSKELEHRLMLSQIEESDARRLKIMSDIGLDHQNKGGGNGLGIQPEGSILPEGQVPNTPGAGIIEVKPAPVITSKQEAPFIQAGDNPHLEMVDIAPNMKMMMPGTRGQETPWEIWAELPAYEKWGLILRNQKYFGGNWLKDFIRTQYLGQLAEENYTKGSYPKGSTNTLVQPSGVEQAVERAIAPWREYKKKYERWSKQHPSGRR